MVSKSAISDALVQMLCQCNAIAMITMVGVSIGLTSSGAIAQSLRGNERSAMTEQTGTFQRLEQPLSRKIAVTVGGLGLIGLELWWFLLSKPKVLKTNSTGGDSDSNNYH